MLFVLRQTDDQILLLQNCWAELLFINASWKTLSDGSPVPLGDLRIGRRHVVTASLASEIGLEDVVRRLVDFTESLRMYEVDVYDLVALKTLLLLSPGWFGVCEFRFIIN
jgi:hypothetical protein